MSHNVKDEGRRLNTMDTQTQTDRERETALETTAAKSGSTASAGSAAGKTLRTEELTVAEELKLLSEAMPPILRIFAALSQPTRAWIIQRLIDDDVKARRAESENRQNAPHEQPGAKNQDV